MHRLTVFLILFACGCSAPRYSAESVMKAQTYEIDTSSSSAVVQPIRGTPLEPARVEYDGLHTEHWVALPSERGAKVKLEDGSVWQISRTDQPQTMLWLVSEKITVIENPASTEFPYKLINKTRQNSADARFLPAGD